MSQQIRLWKITQGEELSEIETSHLDIEERLEDWLARDVSVIGEDLLVIGRQLQTDYGGIIDLLCIDRDGDLAILELKRDKTPRDITAQALDYGSWVVDLSAEEIARIADDYLRDHGPLEKAFRARFGSDLPDTLNESHRMYVIASRIDASSERIIKYLHEQYEVAINAITFQYFKTQEGSELLGQVFLIKPDDDVKPPSKRRPNLTYEQLEALADENGIGDLYSHAVETLEPLFQRKGTTRSGLSLVSRWTEGQTGTLLNFLPGQDSPHGGLPFQAYTHRLAKFFGRSEEDIRALLPDSADFWEYYAGVSEDMQGQAGEFTSATEIDRFAQGLSTIS